MNLTNVMLQSDGLSHFLLPGWSSSSIAGSSKSYDPMSLVQKLLVNPPDVLEGAGEVLIHRALVARGGFILFRLSVLVGEASNPNKHQDSGFPPELCASAAIDGSNVVSHQYFFFFLTVP